jgi:hypothetical protein
MNNCGSITHRMHSRLYAGSAAGRACMKEQRCLCSFIPAPIKNAMEIILHVCASIDRECEYVHRHDAHTCRVPPQLQIFYYIHLQLTPD